MTTLQHQQVVTEKGDAVGRITGINHLVLIVKDMDESVRFYRDLLGFKLVSTRGKFDPRDSVEGQNRREGRSMEERIGKNYFFQIGQNVVALLQVDGIEDADQSVFVPSFWPGREPEPPKRPMKLDHIAFNVETRDDLVWFQEHLRKHGIAVSEIEERAAKPKFVKSIYLYDPNGIPLEIATWDWKDASWEEYRPEDWMVDENPAKSVRS